MVTRKARTSLLRLGLVIPLCLGVVGMSGCKPNYHPQTTHKLNGGYNRGSGSRAAKKPKIDNSNEFGARDGRLAGRGSNQGLFKSNPLSSRSNPLTAKRPALAPVRLPNPLGSTRNAMRQSNPFLAR